MTNNLTNLLPEERHHTLRREYFWRLAVVVAVLAVALIGSAAVLLVPTYLYLSNEVQARTARLADMSSALASSDEAVLLARLSSLSADASTLTSLGSAPSASAVVNKVLQVSRAGITLSQLTYAPAAGNQPGRVVVAGIAATRDALRNYQIALQGTTFAQSADLPVSAYAKDSSISFSITITLAS